MARHYTQRSNKETVEAYEALIRHYEERLHFIVTQTALRDKMPPAPALYDAMADVVPTLTVLRQELERLTAGRTF